MSTLNISNVEITIESGTQYRRKIPFTLLALLLILVHFVFLLIFFEPAISTPDAQGYFAQARLIARQGKTYLEPESILQYIGPHWLYKGDNHYFTTFPPGFPAILAVVYKIFGPKAALLVNPLMFSLSLLGLFLLCRLWVGKGWALLAVALMAVNHFANEHALFGDSHTAIIFFLIWALFFLALWAKTRSSWWAFATGLFMGILPTIRYPEILFCIGFGIFVLLHIKRNRMFWSSLVSFVIGAAIPIGALCIRNQMAFGVFWKTGYALSNEPSQFGFNYIISYYLIYIQKLLLEGCGLVFVLGIIGIIVLCTRRKTWKQGLLFFLLVLPVTLLYMSYFWKPDPQSMRFLLPTFYIYAIAGVWFLKMVTNNRCHLSWSFSIVLLLITILWGLPPSIRSLQHLKERNAVLTNVTGIIEENINPGSILIANEGINQHLDFIGSWRLIDASILKSPEPKPRKWFIQDHSIPKKRELRNIEARIKYAELMGKERFETFSFDVWLWAGEKYKVYIIASEEQISMYKPQLSEYDKLVTIEEIKLPELRPTDVNTPHGFRPPKRQMKGLIAPQDPMGPNQIFDLHLIGEPLFLVEWIREPL